MSKCYRSELVGTFGNPIDENPTGVVMEAGFAAKGLDYRYITMKVEPCDLKAAMEGMKAMQMRGINLTIPFKVEGLKYIDELSPAAEIIGAVNIVVNNNGRLWGENTDGKGLLKSFEEEGVSVRGKTITILGAGGAARAISIECALAGAKKIVIANIIKEQGEGRFRRQGGEKAGDGVEEARSRVLALQSRRTGHEVGQQPARRVEKFLGFVTAHPIVQLLHVARMGFVHQQRHLVGPERPFDLQAVDHFRSRPTLR